MNKWIQMEPAQKKTLLGAMQDMLYAPRPVPAEELAESAGLPLAAVHAGCKLLVAVGYVQQLEGGYGFTEQGAAFAGAVLRNYQAATGYLMETAGLDEEAAAQVACVLEPVLDYDKLSLPEA